MAIRIDMRRLVRHRAGQGRAARVRSCTLLTLGLQRAAAEISLSSSEVSSAMTRP